MNTEKQLMSLINATKALTSTRDLDEVLQLIIEEVLSVFDWADASVLFLLDSQKEYLKAKSAVGFNMEYMGKVALQPNEGMSGKTLVLKEPLLFTSGTDTYKGMSDLSPTNMDFYQKSLGKDHQIPTSTICAPLITEGKCIGVLTIDSFSENVQFNQENLMLLQTFAAQAVIAIENATLISRNERSNRIHRELTKVYMSNQDLAVITKTLSELINKKVGVFNEFFDLLAYTDKKIEKINDLIKEEGSWTGELPLNKKVYIDGEEYQVYFFSIMIDKELAGVLIVAAEEHEVLDSLDIFAIEQATTVFALEIQSLNQNISNQFSYQRSIMNDILKNPDKGMAILKKASFYRKNDVYAFLTVELADNYDPNGGIGLKQSFSRQLHRNLTLVPEVTLVYEDGFRFSILFSLRETVVEADFHKKIRDFVSSLAERFPLHAGVGRIFSAFSDIHYSLQDSLVCVDYIKQIDHPGSYFMTYKELGMYRLFLGMDQKELEGFLRMDLYKILEYDYQHNTELAATLECYLANSQSNKKTAEMMFLHENTVKYRINRIKKILEIYDLAGELGLELYLALKINKYLNKPALSV
ncbi:GAF domain-containing protein [Mesobacillus selenatarsenatis]|nr:GAF domain-containing protein [Mesobacillus selenatarsenatis]